MASVERYLAASCKDLSAKTPISLVSDRDTFSEYGGRSRRLSVRPGALAAALLAALICGSGPARAETVAGVTAGALSVDSSGSANYSIPIDVPPGVAGMEPSLSLSYKSHGGNGLLGVGWSLGGLSVIHRCAQTIAQDGVNGGVNLDADDRFCLDGQRLVAISGTYGAAGTEYRTEIDTFARIISYGTAGTGPESFEVETKSGRILSYGNTGDSRLEADGSATVRLWALDEAADRSGNYMTYHYADDTAAKTFKIERIEYAGNTAAATAPQSEIKFLYETRPDTRSSYSVGSLLNTSERLLRVETWTDGALVRRYEVAYHDDTATHLSRVASVTECDAGTQCFAPITFEWEPEPAGYFEDTDYALPSGTGTLGSRSRFADLNGDGLVDYLYAYASTRKAWLNTGSGWLESTEYRPPVVFWTSSNMRRGTLVDINGDGLPDFIQAYSSAASGRTAWLNTGAGWEVSTEYQPPFQTSYDARLSYLREHCGGVGSGNDNNNCSWRTEHLDVNRDLGSFVELDGDGLVDFADAYLINGTSTRRAWRNTGSGWVEDATLAPPGDTVHHRSYYGTIRTGGQVGGSTRNISAANGTEDIGTFVDVDGDGRSDLLQAYGSRSQVWLNKPSGWVQASDYTPPFKVGYSVNGSYLTYNCRWSSAADNYDCSPSSGSYPYSRSYFGVFADINGDGLVDRLQASQIGGSVTRKVWLNTGSAWIEDAGYQPPVRNYVDSSSGTIEAQLADVNADGLPDYVQSYGSTQATWLNTGVGWQPSAAHAAPIDMATYSVLSAGGGTARGALVDVDGDGLSDVVHINGGTRKTFISNYGAVAKVTGITDPLGRSTSIVCSPLTDGVIYTKGTGAVFPEIDLQLPLYVVEEVSRDDGVGGQARTTYSYEGLKLHAQGRGLLGFSRMTAVDQQTGIEKVTDYRQDFPFIGAVEASETRLADGTRVRTSVNTWSETSLNGGMTTFPHVSSATASSFEINDGPGNTAIVSTTTDTTFDAFGNPTQVTATSTGGGETFVTATSNDFTNDTVNWLIGQLDRAAVTKALPDSTSDTRVTAFDYAPATGLLTLQELEPDLPDSKLTTEYVHDAFGNVKTETLSGVDITTRSTTFDYSPDGRFQTKATNDLGHAETRVFDARFGAVTRLTGPNLITTTWELDGFGRQTRELRADGSETVWSYNLCVAQCPIDGVYAVSEQELNTASQTPIAARNVSYFDALDRPFRAETEGFDGTKVFTDTGFNERGEVVSLTRPYFEGTAVGDIQSATSTYDVLGRTLTVTEPDGGAESTDYAGLTSTMTNALNQDQVRLSNAIGQLIEITDNLGTKVTYAYDPFGNLVETNAGGVVTTMGYDIRGFKTSMSDPDMGVWDYDHNVLGELIFQRDAKGQEVFLEYDTLGRPTRRDEAEGVTTWTYDTAAKGKGKLHTISASHDGYALAQSYDSLGRPSTTTTTIDGVNYAEIVAYDTSGRPEVLTYPSGFAVRNAYNSRGFLTSVSEDGGTTTYWQADSANAEGQVTQETFGNGLITTNSFDPKTSRIDSIVTTQGATTVQDLAYDFDVLGNLKKRSDLRQDREESFLYDGLNRLTTTTLTDTGAGGGTLAAASYNYNAIGNLTFKSDLGTMTYGAAGAGPHAVTEADGKTYSYDANGNMTARLEGGAGGGSGNLAINGFSVPAGDDRVLLAAVSAENRTVDGATFGGQAMAEVGRVSNGVSTVVLYELREAAIGAGAQTGTLAVSLGGTNGSAQLTAWTVTDVDQSAVPVVSQASNGGAAETSIGGTISTTSSSSIVVTAFGLGDAETWSPDAGETQVGYDISAGESAGGASYEPVSAGTHSFGWSGQAAARPSLLLAAYPAAPVGGSGGSSSLAVNNPQGGEFSLPGYTVGAGEDRVLLVAVSKRLTASSPIEVSFGGTPMDLVQEMGLGVMHTALFQLPESSLGSGAVTGDVVVTGGGDFFAEFTVIEAFYLTGIDQGRLAQASSSNAGIGWPPPTQIEDEVTTLGDDVAVLSVLALLDTYAWTPGSGATEILSFIGGRLSIGASYELAPAANTTVHMSWSGTTDFGVPVMLMATYGLATSGGGGSLATPTVAGPMTANVAGGSGSGTAEQTVAWSSFNKPTLARNTATGNEAAFIYGPDRARFKQHVVDNSLAHDVVYIGSLYERRTRFGNPDELVHYIVAGATVAIHTIHDDNLAATNKTRYLHRDHLDSIDTITGETGAVIERLSYDPHGKRRLEDWSAGDPVSPNAETPRGFTGHEHLDSVGLIHMNGRVYDPSLGRFLSADPFVPAPDTTKGFNRYSYVFNNPLSYTDPSGFTPNFEGMQRDRERDARRARAKREAKENRNWFERNIIDPLDEFVGSVTGLGDMFDRAIDFLDTVGEFGATAQKIAEALMNNGQRVAIGLFNDWIDDNPELALRVAEFMSIAADYIDVVADFLGEYEHEIGLAVTIAAVIFDIATIPSGVKSMIASTAFKTGLKQGIKGLDELGPMLKATAGHMRARACGFSFHGDTLVHTEDGYLPIKDVGPDQVKVLARNEETGELAFKTVTDQHWNAYRETVYIEVQDLDTGARQTIVSNRAHPFYVADMEAEVRLVAAGRDGVASVGTNDAGRWVRAHDLIAGDHLFNADESLSEVTRVRIERSPLVAFNLTVADFHTFFVKAPAGNDNDAVWVHNGRRLNGMTREQRWRELAADPKGPLPKEMIDHINRHRGYKVTKRFGQELAHPPKQSAAQGFGYDNALPKTYADHKTQHTYLKERKTGTTIGHPKRKSKRQKFPKGCLP